MDSSALRGDTYYPHFISEAEKAIWDLPDSDGADREYRHQLLRQLPEDFQRSLARQYRETYLNDSRRAANIELRESCEALTDASISLILDDEDLIRLAKLRADQCRRMALRKTAEAAYETLSRYVLWKGIVPPLPNGKRISLGGAIARMSDELWWRRALRTTQARHIEAKAIQLGMVHKHAGIYASDGTVQRCRQQKRRNRDLLEQLKAINELGDEYTLQQLADLSVSNPKIRRGELMARCGGFEVFAESVGHQAVFVTLTTPSRMHARYASSGDANPRYDKTTPKQANAYLTKVWSRIRAKLHRLVIRVYGFRVCEPMHDGTPHMHFLLFIDPIYVTTLQNVFRHYGLQENGDERGAEEHRVKFVEIDSSQGTATGYIAKYISKNIDGYGLDADLYGHEAKSSAERIESWARTWGIRQFQQIGGPPVGIWRVLRLLSEQEPGVIEQARSYADVGDWAGYLRAMDGVTVPRSELPIKLRKERNTRLDRYGETLGYLVVGVQSEEEVAYTSRHTWTVQRRAPEQGAITQLYAPDSGDVVEQATSAARNALSPSTSGLGFPDPTRSSAGAVSGGVSGEVPRVFKDSKALKTPKTLRKGSRTAPGTAPRTVTEIRSEASKPLLKYQAPGLEPVQELSQNISGFFEIVALGRSSDLEFCQ